MQEGKSLFEIQKVPVTPSSSKRPNSRKIPIKKTPELVKKTQQPKNTDRF